jgi:cell cycle arrest protein BUB2
MASSSPQSLATTAHSFNKILNQPRSSKSKRSGDVDEGTKKLRRMILVEGIPSAAVCFQDSNLSYAK